MMHAFFYYVSKQVHTTPYDSARVRELELQLQKQEERHQYHIKSFKWQLNQHTRLKGQLNEWRNLATKQSERCKDLEEQLVQKEVERTAMVEATNAQTLALFEEVQAEVSKQTKLADDRLLEIEDLKKKVVDFVTIADELKVRLL